MANSGYVMLDFTGVDLNNLGEVEGIYAATKAAIETQKPIVISGVVNDTQAFTPMVAYGGVESSTSVFLSFFPITLHINSSDVVSM